MLLNKNLKKVLDIPIFHDDQHGTAIITLAALINALDISKKIKDVKIVINGAGASAQACTNLLKVQVLQTKNIIMCDSKGIIYKGRKNIDQFKSAFAAETKLRTLEEALKGADVFLGLSAKDVVTKGYGKING